MAGHGLNFTRLGWDLMCLLIFLTAILWIEIIMAVLSLLEASGILFTVAALAPIFILPLMREFEDQTSHWFKRFRYWISATYWMASSSFIVQFMIFTMGLEIDDSIYYTHAFFDVAIFFLMVAVALTLGLLLATRAPNGTTFETVVRMTLMMVGGYLLAQRLVFFLTLLPPQISQPKYHEYLLIATFICYLGFLATAVLPRFVLLRGHQIDSRIIAFILITLVFVGVGLSWALQLGWIKWSLP